MRLPTQRHRKWEQRVRDVRVADAEYLEKYLQAQLGSGPRVDILAKYRTWLDAEAISAETADGWPTAAAYNPANIAGFVRAWTEE